MGAFAAPILPDKLDAWKAWTAELTGPRKAEFDDMNARHDLTAHRGWLQQTPDGNQMALVVLDGPGADAFMGAIATSDNAFDVWFREHVAEVHGMDLSGPMPPAPQQFI